MVNGDKQRLQIQDPRCFNIYSGGGRKQCNRDQVEIWKAGGKVIYVWRRKQTVVLNVSEIKKNKAGKVTAAYKLVLLNLPQKAVDWRIRDGNGRGRERNLGMVLRNLTGRRHRQGSSWRCSGIPEFALFWKLCDIKVCLFTCLTSQFFSRHVGVSFCKF